MLLSILFAFLVMDNAVFGYIFKEEIMYDTFKPQTSNLKPQTSNLKNIVRFLQIKLLITKKY